MAICAGRPWHRLLVRHAEAAGAGFDVVAQVVGIRKPEVAMALATEQSGVGQGLILPGGGVEIGRFFGIVRIMARGAGNPRPLGGVGANRIGAELPICGGEEITKSLASGHSPVGQDGGGSVAGDAIFACSYVCWGLAGVRLAEFSGHVGLGLGVTAIGPGIVEQVVRVRELQVPMTLPAQDAYVSYGEVLPRLRAEQRKRRHSVRVIARHIMAGYALQVRPKCVVRRCRVSGEQAVARCEKEAEGLAFGHSSIRENSRRRVTGDAVLSGDHRGWGLSRVRLAEFNGYVRLGVGMDAATPLRVEVAVTISALSGAVLRQRENQDADEEPALLK